MPEEARPAPLILISPARSLAISNHLLFYVCVRARARDFFMNGMNNQLITLPRMLQVTFSVHGGVVREPMYL